jgi:hypothetical protein
MIWRLLALGTVFYITREWFSRRRPIPHPVQRIKNPDFYVESR